MSDRAIEYLDLDDLLALATALLGDPPPVRDLGLLGAAIARPSATAFGEEACAVFLDVNGIDPTTATNDDVFDLVMRVGSEPIDVRELAQNLRGIVERGNG
ncbi:MAG: hypothetical protein WDA60_12900 [Acidimicrobiia bacterium]